MSAEVRITSPAKCILFGEFFVVYGRQALALPVPERTMSMTLRRASWGKVPLKSLHRYVQPAHLAPLAASALRLLGQEESPHLELELSSNIPISAGLGSSAALCVCLLRGLAQLLRLHLPDARALPLLRRLEGSFHESPSGVDTTTAALARPIVFSPDLSWEQLAAPPAETTLVIAWKGLRQSTRAIQRRVREGQEGSLFTGLLEEYDALWRRARAAVEAEDAAAVGACMRENQLLLQELGVVTEFDRRMMEAARAHGSLGEKVTGAGAGGASVSLFHETPAPFIDYLAASGCCHAVITRDPLAGP